MKEKHTILLWGGVIRTAPYYQVQACSLLGLFSKGVWSHSLLCSTATFFR